MSKFKRIAVDAVPVGTVLRAPIGDPNNSQVQLLTEGTEVTSEFLDKLRSRGIAEVVISTRDLALIHTFHSQARSKRVPPPHTYLQSIRFNDHTKAMDQRVHEGDTLEIGEAAEPMLAQIDRPVDCQYDKKLQSSWANQNDADVQQLGTFFQQTCDGETADVKTLRQQCEDILERVRADFDALVCLASTPFLSEYPSRHAVHLASMAMAIGVEMGLDHEQLIDLGIGCLIHDVGMQQIGLRQFDNKSTITRDGLRHLADHPVHALEIASKLGDEVSDASKLVAYQIHERLDGSGYPRGRTAGQIHALARIAAVADTFVALVTPRPHRLGVQGYHAIQCVLNDVKEGRLDPRPVRGLLLATSMHPIGSYVELSNDQLGRVIRTGGAHYDKPTIEMWSKEDPEAEPEIVNLQKDDSVKITRSVPSPRAA
ncbi:MAG: HD domain-containing phosphohydrolase [Planctomycetota bacterium]